MKAKIKIHNPFTFPTYTVMRDGCVIESFYSKKDATNLRNKLNGK